MKGDMNAKKIFRRLKKRFVHGAWISGGNLGFYFPTRPINADRRSLKANPRDR